MNHTFIIRYRDDPTGQVRLLATLWRMQKQSVLTLHQARGILISELAVCRYSGEVIETGWEQPHYRNVDHSTP